MSFPFLSFSLISQDYQKKIENFCNYLPRLWTTSQIGFECPLSGFQNWGDFHCLVNEEEVCENDGFEDPSWKLMTDLFVHWRSAGLFEQGAVSRTILEFDIGSSFIWPPKPNICFLFSPLRTPSFSLIANMVLAMKEKKHILNTIDKFLKKGWTIDGIGLMLARSDCLRVLFRTQSSVDSLIDFFAELKLFGIVDLLFGVFGTFPMRPFLFEIDINENGIISPRIGIDIPPSNHIFSVESILEKLYLRNLVSLDKKNSLLSWGGEDKDLNFNENVSIIRDIHHLKFVSAPNQDLSVKAYLSNRCMTKSQRISAN